ncbi:MAG: leucyl/phenylalanyl-tRNA--protein transferase [Eubacterium sp.]|nr:leucyl/phenylalanyl-tRNA--protein transferase [Eubacterium sp.]
MPVFRLSRNINVFPDPSLAEPDGLLAIGGDLSVERLLIAYENSIFPWYDDESPIMWWSPPERFIIIPENIHISHSMRKFFKKHDVKIEINRDFSDTMHHCRTVHESEGEWIIDEMEEAYGELHRAGYAVGVESFIDGKMAGGLYGVVIGKCFFGESMFTIIENGSKVALILLAKMLAEKGFVFIDCQFHTDHLESMGGITVTRDEYLKMLKEGIEK